MEFNYSSNHKAMLLLDHSKDSDILPTIDMTKNCSLKKRFSPLLDNFNLILVNFFK